MSTKRWLVIISGVIALWVAFCGAAAAKCDVPKDLLVPTGYLTGRDLIGLTDPELQGYLIGFVNGSILSVVMGAATNCVEQAHQCIARRPTNELAKAVRIYIADNAKRLKDDAAMITFNVLFGTCVAELGQPTGTAT